MKILRIVVLVIIILLIIARLLLPHYLLKYVVNQINKIPEYKVRIADLDVHLIRGAYTIKGISLWKVTKDLPVPFFKAKAIDFSIEWASLFHGKVLAKVGIQSPEINFVTDPSGKNEQLSISNQWLGLIKSLYPLNINRLDAFDGKVNLISFNGDPPFKIYLTNSQLTMANMQKATQEKNLLASAFSFTGDMIRGGKVDIAGKYDPFNKTPTFELKVKLTALQVAQIAGFLKHYTLVDVSGGLFSLYGKVVAANRRIDGEVKPFIKDLKIGNPNKPSSPLSAIVNGAATVAAKILENPQKDTIATRIKISGNVDEPDTSILSIIGYLFRHAFIQALIPTIDSSVKMQDVLYGSKPKKSSKPSPQRSRKPNLPAQRLPAGYNHSG